MRPIIKPIKTLLLLAGQSTRFWPLTEKPLFPIAGKTLLQHIVDRLKEAGCDDIVFIGSKNNLEEARKIFPDSVMVEQENLEQGMRGALLSSLPRVGNEAVLVIGANDVLNPEAYQMTIEKGQSADGAILAQKVERYFPGGYLSIEGDRVTGIVEKPGEGNEPSDLVTIVCHYHANGATLLTALQEIDDATDDGYGYEKALGSLFKSHTYAAVPYDSTWQAVKYPWHLLHLLPILLEELDGQSIHSSAHIHQTAVIEGPVMICENVRILPNACIVGPVFIGKNTIIGNNALVRGSSIGEHCVVGYNTEVKNSLLCDHVWTHSTYLGDSVIGENVSFGAGSVTGNLRLDEGEIHSEHREDKLPTGLTKMGTIIGRDSRIGIHVGINPGVKIGQGTFVSSGTLVDRDVPDRSFVKMKNGVLDVRENTAEAPKPEGREQYKNHL
ncbi:NTP transferase domain-containing protein [Candidatus Peribacteria bacterium]|nr:MAG: NTP transferase domain-containing protein [Candidatus Peribacteria bacterium]